MSALRVAVVGCGLIGHKRAAALGGDALVACHDVDRSRAEHLAAEAGGRVAGTLAELLDARPDVVVVAVLHCDLAEIACAALEAGSHVLVEKPAGVGVADVDRIAKAAAGASRLVKVGFNHRFYPGIARAVAEARSGVHGEVMHLRAVYGHGGRLGYEREWRADPALSGGGELVDQGMHLLDLSHWLLGELPLHSALLRTHFWKAPVEDNAVLLLGTRGGIGDASAWALLHTSWTEWKNQFHLDIYCERARLSVDGLAGSYGNQTLRIYRMRPELGPPDIEEPALATGDPSFVAEWAHFREAILAGDRRELLGDLDSARYAWSRVEDALAS